MYNPRHFETSDIAGMHALMRQHNFAILVTQHGGAPFATHLPFLLDEARGPYGTLLAHLARPNPQWHDLAAGGEALVIFQGAHAYISPSWYASAPSVPTWNYSIVHAYGTARIVDDRAELYAMMRRLVETHESGFERPWRMDLPEDYMERMLRGVVGFELAITRLEGKSKLSQNRDAADRAGVAAALSASADPLAATVAAQMQAEH
jgi:transcriptional regulator